VSHTTPTFVRFNYTRSALEKARGSSEAWLALRRHLRPIRIADPRRCAVTRPWMPTSPIRKAARARVIGAYDIIIEHMQCCIEETR
jgi:hypothetical protein